MSARRMYAISDDIAFIEAVNAKYKAWLSYSPIQLPYNRPCSKIHIISQTEGNLCALDQGC